MYTTFILGTALLNFCKRANNVGHGPLDFCRVKANFSTPVRAKSCQEVVSTRLNRGPRVETGGILIPRVFEALMTDHETEGSWVGNELSGRQNAELFTGRTMGWKYPCKNCM